MELAYKPDLEEAKERWRAFWTHEIIDRPCCVVTAPLEGAEPVAPPPYLAAWDLDYHELAEQFDAHAATVYYGGEAIPFRDPSFGPDMFGAWLGGELERSDDSKDATSWAVPVVEDWAEVLPLKLDPNNKWWQETLKLVRAIAEVGEGKFLTGALDLHSNADALISLRRACDVCMDLLLVPDLIHQAMRDVRAVYQPVYNAFFEASGGPERGSIGWAPFYCEGKFAMTQCDFAIAVSPQMFNEFILPALEEEWAFLDRTIYHYDGAGALVHLDTILANPDIDGIQWVPGAGAKPLIEWMDLLKTIQAADKSLQVYGTPEEIKIFHKELKPELCCYTTSCSSQREADELLKWLVDNT